MYISPLQIEFSPLRQYAYVPAPNSKKIEGNCFCVFLSYKYSLDEIECKPG